MLSIDALDVIHLGRSPGGDRFTAIVDSLIRTQCFVSGVKLAEIKTNLRTNIPDGGVDTKVDVPLQNDPTGWMAATTVWQYKARQSRDISEDGLRKEIRKEYSSRCISQGYAYRYCICDGLSPEKKEAWEKVMFECAQEINSNALPVRVVDANDLAAWVGRFPALAMDFLKGGFAAIVLCFVNGGQIFILDKSPPWQRFHSSPPSIDNRPENRF